ncbi:MAG: DUF5320 family protein [bacterium]|nr:MAG: DUF5320 family protein [bacterium]
MKIAITATGSDLQAQVDPRFGRAQYFIIVDPETMEFEAIENTSVSAAHGAGIQSGQLISSKEVTVVITGSVGPNAYQTLTAAGIQIFQTLGGTVAQTIDAYKNRQLQHITQVGPAHGGMGMGGGMGTGRGIGMGRSLSRGMGGGAGFTPQSPPVDPMTKEQEIQNLKSQADMLAQQLEAINMRISELEKK